MVEPRRVENWDWDDDVGGVFDVIVVYVFMQPRDEMQQPYRTRPNSASKTTQCDGGVQMYQHPTDSYRSTTCTSTPLVHKTNLPLLPTSNNMIHDVMK